MRWWLGLCLFLLPVPVALAQLAPSGDHYAGKPSDTGRGGELVNATGSIAASVPLQLPDSREALPIPIQIAYGGGFGAGGVGWHLPLSYVQHDRTFARRRPASAPNAIPSPRARTYVSLLGQTVELAPSGADWIARRGTRQLVAREGNGQWRVYDGAGNTYVFARPTPYGATGLWLLKSIIGAKGAEVRLTYRIDNAIVDGGAALSVNLIRLSYNYESPQACAKNEVAINYGSASPKPLSLAVIGDKLMVRRDTVDSIVVTSRASCATAPTQLRRYEFEYSDDADTLLPRLHAVRMRGREGTTEANVAVPVANYSYGSATVENALRYESTQALDLPAGASALGISGTALDPSTNVPINGDRYAMWQSLTDMTGDGRPDLVFKKNGQLSMAYNLPGPGANSMIGVGNQAIVPLTDSTLTSGALATHSSAERRFQYAPANRNTTNVWRQMIDVNGDGRVDLVDAAAETDRWVIYLNTPGGPSGVQWRKRVFAVGSLRATLSSRGHLFDSAHVPLARRTTGTNIQMWECWRWTGASAGWQWWPQGFSNHRCQGTAQQITARGPEHTIVEWELSDLNGDGYPDFVFNSTPVDFQLVKPATDLGQVIGQVWPGDFGVGGPLWRTLGTQRRRIAGVVTATNEVRIAFNVLGVRFDTSNPFARSVPLQVPLAEWGVGAWRCVNGGQFDNDPCDDSRQQQFVGFADVTGDGVPERIVGDRAHVGVFAGTAAFYSRAFVRLPGPLAQTTNTHATQCAAGGNQKPTTDQVRGLRDLTGDGIPDYYDDHKVWIGTGAHFRPPIPIRWTGAKFVFSHQTESCDGAHSFTDGGLYDIDGDGKPDVLGLGGNQMFVTQLAGGHARGRPEAGKLTDIDNGYGAIARVRYASAKHHTTSPVPFPEIVVGSVSSEGVHGLGGTLLGSRFAYDRAALIFDSAADRYTFAGYGRTVEVRLSTGGDRPEGFATITDAWPLTSFSPGLDRQARWLRAQRVGRLRDVITLRATANADPWSLLGVTPSDGRVIGVSHHDWQAKLYDLPPSAAANAVDCMEMFEPLDFAQSFGANLGTQGIDACRAQGFAYRASTESWYGASEPPSTNNVQTLWRVTDVDEYGRMLSEALLGDRFRSDDDVCIERRFAAPVAPVPRVLSAIASRRITDCAQRTTVFRELFDYDGLANGAVAGGRLTAKTVERRATDNGALLSTVRVFDATYDVRGNIVAMQMQRGNATRTTKVSYDPFGLAPILSTLTATGAPTITTVLDYDPVTLDVIGTTDANGLRVGGDYDGFGRMRRSTVSPPAGPTGVMALYEYVGTVGNDPAGRRVRVTRFSDPVPATSLGSAGGRSATTYLDELGRERFTEIGLGGDYAQERLVVAERRYDGLGRVSFQADDYPRSANAAAPYGTSFLYDRAGELQCLIRGHGPQPLSQITDVASERFSTCYSHSHDNHVVTVDARDAASLQPGSAQAGVVVRTVTSAIGRLLERSSLQNGTRLEHATLQHDRLGQLRSFTRYADPVGATGAVTWYRRLDSLGQTLQFEAPGAPPRFHEYSGWGELTQTRFVEGTIDHRLVRDYDALGRIVRTSERANGIEDPLSVHEFQYDVMAGVSPLLTSTFLIGRLAAARSPSGQVAFSYDALGRENARLFTPPQGGPYLQRTQTLADGTPTLLEFRLPDSNFQPEFVKYGFDSAGRLRTITYADAQVSADLFMAEDIDIFGRLRKGRFGDGTTYSADYAMTGRRLLREALVESTAGARRIINVDIDAAGRSTVRREVRNGAASGPKTNLAYDALGRLSRSVLSDGPTTIADWSFQYDALGNITRLEDLTGTADASLSYDANDPDRVCRIGYGNSGLGGASCNVAHDGMGNVVAQATRGGTRDLTYDGAGRTRSITEQSHQARWSYDAFGQVATLEITGPNGALRRERRLGPLLEERDIVANGAGVLARHIPGPAGIVASRLGAGNQWVFGFGELRGSRFFTDRAGDFIQDVTYQPFGESTSSGVAASDVRFSNAQWNGGDALAPFGLAQLGARVYDPVIGRFLSRDPLVTTRSAGTSNPYGFAANDPINAADPSGLDCVGETCNPDTPIVPPFGAAYDFLQSAFGGSSGPPPAPAVSAGPKSYEGRMTQKIMREHEGFEDDALDWDALAAMKLPYDDLVGRIMSTRGTWYPKHEGLNPVYDLVGSMGAGFGDFSTFGATSLLRNQVFGGFNSVDTSSGAYYAGGIATLVFGPTALLSRGAKAGSEILNAEANLAREANALRAAEDSLMSLSQETVAGYAITGSKALVGSTYARRILMLENLAGRSNSTLGLRRLLNAFEAEARAAGATELRIHALAVKNGNFFNMSKAWERFGFTFEPIGNSSFIITKPL